MDIIALIEFWLSVCAVFSGLLWITCHALRPVIRHIETLARSILGVVPMFVWELAGSMLVLAAAFALTMKLVGAVSPTILLAYGQRKQGGRLMALSKNQFVEWFDLEENGEGDLIDESGRFIARLCDDCGKIIPSTVTSNLEDYQPEYCDC